MLLPISGLETHPLGTSNPNAIINANWSDLEALLYAIPQVVKTPSIDGTSMGTTSFVNPTGAVSATSTAIVGDGTTVTVTIPNAYQPGQYAVISGADSGFNGTFLIATASATQFTFENTTSGTSSTQGTVTVGLRWMIDKILFVPIDLNTVVTLPTIEIGEDVVGLNSLVSAVTPTATGSQIQELTLINPRPLILPGGSLKATVTVAGAATKALFQIWAKIILQ